MTALQTTTTDMEEIEPTEWAYQSGLEATAAERRLESKEAIWEADEDWQAFRTLCYPDPGAAESARNCAGIATPVCSGRPRQCGGAIPSGNNFIRRAWACQVKTGLVPGGLTVSGCDRRWPSHGHMAVGGITDDKSCG